MQDNNKTCKKVMPLIGEVQYKCTESEFNAMQNIQNTQAQSWVAFKDTASKTAEIMNKNIFKGPAL